MKKVLGMGNALMDILMDLKEDQLLSEFSLPKGSMQLIDTERAKIIDQATSHLSKTITTGGFASNTIHGIAHLGTETGFIGKVGKDEKGELFYNDMHVGNINPHLIKSDSMTGFATAFVSQDGERTFATFLGAAAEMNPEDINPSLFDDYAVFHIEGYLVQNHALIKKSVELAKEKGLCVSLDLASYNVVEANLAFLRDLVQNSVDIVFANEEEAKAFTHKEPEEALLEIAKLCKIAVVKVGAKGSMIQSVDKKHHIQPYKSVLRDTTGAGDIYAAGFLHAYVNNYPLEICGKLGSYLSSKVIGVMGPKFPDTTWKEMQDDIKHILQH